MNMWRSNDRDNEQLDEMASSLIDFFYVAEDKEPSKTTTCNRSDKEVRDNDENNNAEVLRILENGNYLKREK